jgi:hypothetical protein
LGETIKTLALAAVIAQAPIPLCASTAERHCGGGEGGEAVARLCGGRAGGPRSERVSRAYDTGAEVVSVTSALGVFANPERGNQLAALGEVTRTSLLIESEEKEFGRRLTEDALASVVGQDEMRHGRPTHTCAPNQWARAC